MNLRTQDRYNSELYIRRYGSKVTADLDVPTEVELSPEFMTEEFEVLLDCMLAEGPQNAFIDNVEDSDETFMGITDKKQAIKFIVDEIDPAIGNEIKQHLRQIAGLTEEEEKNSE